VRICLANLDYTPLRTSGLGAFGETLANGLASAGHDVTMVTRGAKGLAPFENIQGVSVYRMPFTRGDWLGYSWQVGPFIARLHTEQPFDIIHFLDVHFAWRFQGPFLAMLNQSFRQRLTSDSGRPYHANTRELVVRSVYYRAARYLAEIPSLRRARHFTAMSQAAAQAFIAEGHVRPDQVTVIPAGIDLDRLRRRDASALRSRLGLEGKRVLLYVGFGTARKGLTDLAQAMQYILPEAHLVMVGRWEEAYLRRFDEALGDQAHRVLKVGYVPDEELPFYYSLADLFVFPTLLEGFGLPLAEALACGTPVITTHAQGASAETAGPGALTVPPRDAHALARAVNDLLTHEVKRRHLAEEGQTWARRRYDQRAMVATYIRLYEALRFR